MVAREADNTAKGNGARRNHLNFESLDISSSIKWKDEDILLQGKQALKFFYR